MIVHRCGGALAPENTLAGLALAARLGFSAVEFDVMLSADGTPVLIHDELLDRTTDRQGAVAATPDAALRGIDAGVRHHPAFAGEHLPTLDEALSTCLALNLVPNIEIKPAAGCDAATGRAVAALVAARWPADRTPVLLSSFSAVALGAAREAAVGVPRALLTEKVSAQVVEQARMLGCVSLHASASALTMPAVRVVRAAGLHLAIYTVDQPLVARRLWLAGAVALFTDRPDRFAQNEYEVLMDGLVTEAAG
ncbi:MAG: glycerophosphodiester phosphodiesterase [Zoogloea sp.]|nr:glycerophosphodiester phosphodiesterase [Zoogloea sp.]